VPCHVYLRSDRSLLSCARLYIGVVFSCIDSCLYLWRTAPNLHPRTITSRRKEVLCRAADVYPLSASRRLSSIVLWGGGEITCCRGIQKFVKHLRIWTIDNATGFFTACYRDSFILTVYWYQLFGHPLCPDFMDPWLLWSTISMVAANYSVYPHKPTLFSYHCFQFMILLCLLHSPRFDKPL
jgi:hypothetical protein